MGRTVSRAARRRNCLVRDVNTLQEEPCDDPGTRGNLRAMKHHLVLVFLLLFPTACSSGSVSAGTSDAEGDVAADGGLTPDGADDVGNTVDAPADAVADADGTPPDPDAAEEVDDDTGISLDGIFVPDTEPEVVQVDVGDPDVAGKEQPTEHPPIQDNYETGISEWTMGPGEEITKCVVKKLGNTEAIWVTAVHTSLAAGSHHMIVYKTGDQEEQAEPFGCTPFTETLSGQAFPLIITQIAEESLIMPPGVAVKFEPNQTIRIEAHFLNYYPDEITAQGEVTFDTIAEEDVWKEANMLFYGDVDFQIPANSEYQTDWAFLQVNDGVEVFAVTGHTHQYGTNVEVYQATSAEDDSTPIYPLDIPFQWDESPVTQYDPPLSFDGENGFRFRCTWNNTTDKKLDFGESADKEMCFLWAYYYPSDGYQVCVKLGSVGAGFGLENICCPGSFICDLIPGFL